MQATVPRIRLPGMFRVGFLTSPATNDRVCQPSYAQSTPINAIPNADMPSFPDAGQRLPVKLAQFPCANRKTVISRRPPNLIDERMFWTHLPKVTPRQLIVVKKS